MDLHNIRTCGQELLRCKSVTISSARCTICRSLFEAVYFSALCICFSVLSQKQSVDKVRVSAKRELGPTTELGQLQTDLTSLFIATAHYAQLRHGERMKKTAIIVGWRTCCDNMCQIGMGDLLWKNCRLLESWAATRAMVTIRASFLRGVHSTGAILR